MPKTTFNPTLASRLLTATNEVDDPNAKRPRVDPTPILDILDTAPRPSVVPSAPVKSRNNHQELKYGDEEALIKDNCPFNVLSQSGFKLDDAYQLGKKCYTVIKQKNALISSHTALFMLLTDLMRTNASIILKRPFFEWIAANSPQTSDTLIDQAKQYQITLKSEELSPNTALDIIKKRLQESGNSVIVSISNPYYTWVVVDYIDAADNVYFRNPLYGKAYSTSGTNFCSFMEDDEDIDCLSVINSSH